MLQNETVDVLNSIDLVLFEGAPEETQPIVRGDFTAFLRQRAEVYREEFCAVVADLKMLSALPDVNVFLQRSGRFHLRSNFLTQKWFSQLHDQVSGLIASLDLDCTSYQSEASQTNMLPAEEYHHVTEVARFPSPNGHKELILMLSSKETVNTLVQGHPEFNYLLLDARPIYLLYVVEGNARALVKDRLGVFMSEANTALPNVCWRDPEHIEVKNRISSASVDDPAALIRLDKNGLLIGLPQQCV